MKENHAAAKKPPQIKICGITSIAEAEYLNEAEADYAGFVFYEKSRRNIEPEEAARIAKHLSKRILKVAVTVNPSAELIRKIKRQNFDILQVHGEFDPEVRKNANLPVWRAVNVTDSASLEEFFAREILERESAEGMETAGCLIDGASYGGGKTFDWQEAEWAVMELFYAQARIRKLAASQHAGRAASRGENLPCSIGSFHENFKRILAGGLTEENVREGILRFCPDVVDVSSGVEENGKKSREKIKRFVRKVREYE